MKTLKTIVIATDFTDAPGARYKEDGPFSGEHFYLDLLRPAFVEVLKQSGALLIDLDDTWGYASSFISGSFGKLSQEFGDEIVLKHLLIKSDDSTALIRKGQEEIKHPIKVK